MDAAIKLNHQYYLNVAYAYLNISMHDQPQALDRLKGEMKDGGKNGLELGGGAFVHVFQEEVILLGGTKEDLAPPSLFLV